MSTRAPTCDVVEAVRMVQTLAATLGRRAGMSAHAIDDLAGDLTVRVLEVEVYTYNPALGPLRPYLQRTVGWAVAERRRDFARSVGRTAVFERHAGLHASIGGQDRGIDSMRARAMHERATSAVVGIVAGCARTARERHAALAPYGDSPGLARRYRVHPSQIARDRRRVHARAARELTARGLAA